MLRKTHDDTLLEQAADQIRGAEPDPRQVEASAARVWQRLSSSAAQSALAEAAEVDEIRDCADYQALIPAFLTDSLPQARRMLLEDHTGECVPCRRALMDARQGKTPQRANRAARDARENRGFRRASSSGPGRRTSRPAVGRWAMAAAMVLALAAGLFLVSETFLWSGPTATVHTVDGNLFRVAATSQLPIAVGDVIEEGEVLRTGRDGGAVVELTDGSLVELRERSEVTLQKNPGGMTIELSRGNVIVEAAKQRDGHLYVATEDCLVSVKGTIFSVNHGIKGSRVAVIEGEVHVEHSGEEAVLRPGDQVSTQSTLDPIPVSDEIAWSRDVDRYLTMLEELTDLKRALREEVPQPNLRFTSQLLDLSPEGTAFYTAVPNLAETLARSHEVIDRQLGESEVLSEWWQDRDGGHMLEETLRELADKLGELGEYLGDEIVLAGRPSDNNVTGLGMAEVVDSDGLRDFLLRLGTELGARYEIELDGDEVIFVEDPRGELPDGELYLWLGDGLAVMTPDADSLRAIAAIVLDGATNPFVGSDFHTAIADLYDDGVGFLVAADLESIVAFVHAGSGEHRGDSEHLAFLGVDNARHLLFEQKTLERTHHRAVVTFRDARHGVASWLAEPAAMGSLDFISPDAKLVTAMVIKDPTALLDDIEAFAGEGTFEDFEEFEQRHGLSFRDDFAAVLGGEVAFAVDGPVLPKISWKLILEVYDPARFQWTIEQVIAEANDRLREEGKEEVEIVVEEAGGRTFYTVKRKVMEMTYTFADGYFVAAPTRALLERSLKYRESGYGITDSERFVSLLPPDGNNNFSALAYQDLGSWMESIAGAIGEGVLDESQRQRMDAIKGMVEPTLGYAYGEEDRITVAASMQDGLLGTALQGLFGMQGTGGWQDLIDRVDNF